MARIAELLLEQGKADTVRSLMGMGKSSKPSPLRPPLRSEMQTHATPSNGAPSVAAALADANTWVGNPKPVDDSGYRKIFCQRCGEWKVAGEFRRKNGHSLQSCKSCNAEAVWESRRRNQQERENAPKTCSHCREQKPRTEFAKSSKARDGLQFWCRTCKSASNAGRRKVKPEAVEIPAITSAPERQSALQRILQAISGWLR